MEFDIEHFELLSTQMSMCKNAKAAVSQSFQRRISNSDKIQLK